MLYGINEKGVKIAATPKERRSKCQCCGHELIAKCGEINIWHWAHESNAVNCDYKPETNWHLSWKSLFPKEQCEVRMIKNGVTKIADAVLKSGVVVEFQHSSISTEEIKLRESFYGNMVWIFDCIEAREKNRLIMRPKRDYTTFRWKYAKKTIAYCGNLVYLDIGDSIFHLRKIGKESPIGGWGYLKDLKDFKKLISSNQ